MKITIRILAVILTLIMVFSLFASCSKSDNTTTSEITSQTGTDKTYTVTFKNADIPSQSVKSGSVIQKPTDPEKDGNVFAGWYKDKELTSEVSFPLTVNGDMTLYAKFDNYREAFKEAREKTVGDNVNGFTYEYTLDASASLSALSLSGKTEGKTQYSKEGEISFYDSHKNSGVLFIDGYKYQIKRGSDLQKISADENKKVTSYSVEQVDNSYKYDSSSFAKAVFEYSDDQLKSIEKTSDKNVYKIKTALNASSVIALLGNYINNPMVEKIIGEMPETAVDTGMFVKFSGGKIDSYTYEMHIDVSALKFDLTYKLKFTDVGNAKAIVAETFPGISLSPAEIASITAEAGKFISDFRKSERSGYDFKVDTGVDFGVAEGEINSTFKGSALRKVTSETVFFHNDIEIDSDFKNKDLYKSDNVSDVHVKLTKLSNGEVHIIEKKLLADSTKQIENYKDSDKISFYLFDVFTNSGAYSFAEKTEKSGETVYKFGITNSGAADLIEYFNSSLDIDPLDNSSKEIKVYGNISKSSLLVQDAAITVTVKSGRLDGISVSIDCDATTSFAQSVDFAESRKAQIKLDFSLSVNTKGDSFEPFDTVKAAK